jgi:hypothetical protein
MGVHDVREAELADTGALPLRPEPLRVVSRLGRIPFQHRHPVTVPLQQQSGRQADQTRSEHHDP